MKLNVGQGLVVVSLAMGLAACGPKLQSVSEQDGSATADPSRRETVTVGVNLAERKAGFALAGVTNYSMSLEGCASGYSETSITQSNPSIDLYKFDQNCKVKLNSFIINGASYAPGTDAFTSWLADDSAIFESATSTEKFTVKVISQLSSPIATADTVSYAFTQLLEGDDALIAKDVVGANHTISVSGIDAAAVDIIGVAMTGMSGAGAGEFKLTLECANNVTGTGAATACGSNLLTSLKYRLVEDTYGGTLNETSAADLFASAGTSVDSNDILAIGSAAPKGGFAVTVSGPSPIHTKPNMLFVIQSGGASYKYFNVDVETLLWSSTPAP
jgi:hypothetical protein